MISYHGKIICAANYKTGDDLISNLIIWQRMVQLAKSRYYSIWNVVLEACLYCKVADR